VSDRLRSWLRRQPQPAKLKLDDAKSIVVPEGRGRWRTLLETLAAHAPKKLEALDADDKPLRATACTQEDWQDEDEDDDRERRSGAPTRDIDIDTSTPLGALVYTVLDQNATIRELAETVRMCAEDNSKAYADVVRARAQVQVIEKEVRAEQAGEQQSDLQAIMGAFGAAAQAKAANQGHGNGQAT
jgi:hypothetical protein